MSAAEINERIFISIIIKFKVQGSRFKVQGPKIAELKIKSTGGKDVYKLMQAKVKKVAGVHDLYFCFDDADQGDKDLFNFDFWYFK